ncbi:hypothetical protein [Aeromonas veronii]|uniref:hypothetical protein n=1 Tax=Aeromonas veronii TaxID=654 RepID=UPI001116BA96|nr:hypothetical protein [Aeromonas veronii]
MTEQAITPTPSLLRDYCTIERASRLLNCEVEDILQWGATGSINLMVNLNQWNEPAFGSVEHRWHRCAQQLTSDEVEDIDVYDGPPEPDAVGVIDLSGGMAWYSDIEPFDSGSTVSARLGGFWCVEPSFLYRNLLGHPIQHLDLFSPSTQTITSETAEAIGFISEVESPFPTYWVNRWALEAMHEHIQHGVRLLMKKEQRTGIHSAQQKHSLVITEDANQTPRGKALVVIGQLIKLIPDLDDFDTLPSKTTYEIISAKLSAKGLGPLAVGSRMFLEWGKVLKD